MTDEPDLEIPPFLRRAPLTPEQFKRLVRKGQREQTRIKNPPKRVRKSTRLLGMPAVGWKPPKGA